MFGDHIPPARPGRRVLGRSIEGLRVAASRLARQRPGTGLLAIDTPSGRLDRKAGPRTFHATLTGSTSPYSFSEVYGVPTPALWAALPGGRSGVANAYALNGTAGKGGQVVELHPAGSLGEWYWFDWKTLGQCVLYDPSVCPDTLYFCGLDLAALPSTLTLTWGSGGQCRNAYDHFDAWSLGPLGITLDLFTYTGSYEDYSIAHRDGCIVLHDPTTCTYGGYKSAVGSFEIPDQDDCSVTRTVYYYATFLAGGPGIVICEADGTPIPATPPHYYDPYFLGGSIPYFHFGCPPTVTTCGPFIFTFVNCVDGISGEITL